MRQTDKNRTATMTRHNLTPEMAAFVKAAEQAHAGNRRGTTADADLIRLTHLGDQAQASPQQANARDDQR